MSTITQHHYLESTTCNSAASSSTESQNFRFYQITSVGASDRTIRTVVPVHISAPPCIKTLIANFLFAQILDHVDKPTVYISDWSQPLLLIQYEYHYDRERGRRSCYFNPRLINNTVGVDFFNSKGRSVTIDDASNRSLDIYYFTFRFTVRYHIIGLSAPNFIHNFKFSLYLSRTYPFPSAYLTIGLLAPSISFPVILSSRDTFYTTLDQFSDTQQIFMSVTQFLSARCDNLPTLSFFIITHFLNFSTPLISINIVTTTSNPR